VTIINYASCGVNKLRASLNDDTRVVIYDRHMFIVQATGEIKCQQDFITYWIYKIFIELMKVLFVVCLKHSGIGASANVKCMSIDLAHAVTLQCMLALFIVAL
jgi:hypothetical protein